METEQYGGVEINYDYLPTLDLARLFTFRSEICQNQARQKYANDPYADGNFKDKVDAEATCSIATRIYCNMLLEVTCPECGRFIETSRSYCSACLKSEDKSTELIVKSVKEKGE